MTAPVRILGIATAVPPAAIGPEESCRMLGYTAPKAFRVFRNAGVTNRNLGLDPATFRPTESPDELNARFERVAMAIGAEACRGALEDAGVPPGEIALVIVATCTGYLCPGLATRLAPVLGLTDAVERGDLVGHGCSGAFPALQRGFDFAAARPGKSVLVLCVEVCSAAYFMDDEDETLVANALCADGAAAVVLRAGEGRGPILERFASALAPEHLDLVGFTRKDGHLRVRLDESIPDIAGPLLRRAVDRLDAGTVSRWVLHPGGKRVLEKAVPAAGLPPSAATAAAKVYREHGNMSSPTVLFVLEEVLRGKPLAPGETLVMAGLGPGFVAEAALLRG